MRIHSRCFVITILVVAAVPAAWAQSFTGSILGTVRDSSGSVVPNVAVTVINTGTNARTEARSDAGGNYIAPLLAPGGYGIEAVAPGFKKFAQSGIVVQVQQQARVDVVLTVGEVTESVQVSADASVLETSTSSIGRVVDNRRIVNLPLNTRNVYSLIFLTPGVSGTVGNNYGDMRYSVNGARARMLDTLIDGVSASHSTVTGFSGISVFPSVDAIEEFKVMGANYPAEFGRSNGSVLNVIFKSGTNLFHGSAYEFLRNSVLDSQNFFDNRRGAKLASFKRSQFGGNLTGPIQHDKTFFLYSFEGLREPRAATTTFTVPTLLERRGDFSQTLAANRQLIAVFDPFSTRANPAGGFLRDAFPGNVIPAGRFDPVAVNALKYFPEPNQPGDAVTRQNNFSNSGSRNINLNQWDARIDRLLTTNQKFFARFSYRKTTDVPPVYFPKDLTIAEGRIIESDRVRGAVADYTNTLSPTTIFNARLGFARTLYVYDNQGLGFKPSQLGLPAAIDSAVDVQLFPRIGAGGYYSLGGNDHRWNAFNSHTALANITKILGAHTIKVGFEGRMFRVNVREAQVNGNFNFSQGFTQGPDPNRASATAGNSIASLVVGAGSGNILQNSKNTATQSFYLAGYIQDDWRVTRKLTLNLGLRYDIDTPRTERFNRTNFFDPYVASPLGQQVPGFSGLRGGLVFVGVDGRPRHQYIWDKNDIAPRLGFAYQLTPRTVLRGGYGHLFGISHQAAHGTFGSSGYRVNHQWVGTIDGITPLNPLRNPFPLGFPPVPGSRDGLLTEVGSSIDAVLQNAVAPWSMQWNFNVQRELPAQVLLEVAYVGTRGLQLHRNGEGGINLNQLLPDQMALGSRLNETVDNPFFGRGGRGILATPRIGRRQLLRPFPQFDTLTPLFTSGASSNYHSLQVTMSKRLSHGLLFEGSYTWAKNIDDGMTHQNSYDTFASRSLADIDVAHRFVMSYIYELPFGRGRRFGGGLATGLNFFLGGWQFNGITAFQSGTPLSISANNSAGLFNPVTRPNSTGRSGLLAGKVDQRLGRYFDTTAYAQPVQFTFGNLSPRLPDIRNDGIRNWDLSLFKDFAVLAENRLTAQFRAEFLNAFNTPRFGGPNTSVTSSSFGVISSQANAPRQIQFGLKLLW